MISKFEKMPLFNKVRFFICIGVILLSILLFVYGQFRISALSDIHDADLKTLSDLNNKSTMDEIVSTADSVSDFKVYSATEAGNKVAKTLNAMQTFDEKLLVQNEAELSSYFVSNNSEALSVSSIFGNQLYHNQIKAMRKVDIPHWTWTYLTDYKTASTTQYVSWICRDDATGVVLSTMSATYNVVNDKFSNFKTYVTKTGDSYSSGGYGFKIDDDLIPITEPSTTVSEMTVETTKGLSDK